MTVHAWPRAAVLLAATSIALIAPSGVSSASPSPAPSPYVIKAGEPWIAYEWVYGDTGVKGYGVYLVRPDGSGHHVLLNTPVSHPDWSPDGKRLVVDTEPANGEQVWTVDADGTNAQVVTCDGDPCGPVAAPAWSPDGTQLAFQRGIPQPAGSTYDRVGIEVVDLATGAVRVVAVPPVADTEYVEFNVPRWSPDGSQIVFTVMRYPVPPTNENILDSSIAVVNADGSEADAPRVLTDPALFASYPDWSPDGQRIVFNTYPLGSFQETTKATNLYTIRPDGTGLSQVTQFGENDTRATQPTWTPDGKQIVFTQIERNPSNPLGERHVALIDADGSNLTLLPVPADAGVPGEVWYGTHARMRPTP